MKQFLKFVLATITGMFILAGIFFIVILSMVSGLSKSDKKVIVEENSVLVMSLNYEMTDRTSDNPFETFAAELAGDMSKPIGMLDVVKAIDAAKQDEHIKGILLDITFVSAGYGKLGEIRAALESFKESGKFVYAYGEIFYNKTYYFSSVADKVFLNPKGSMLFNGMVAEVLFLKETLAKLGIEMQAIKHGKFKGAVEPFTLDKLSDENRNQIDTYLQSVYSEFIRSIGVSRNLSSEQLKEIANGLKVTNPEQALENKLVDQLAYRDEVVAAIAEKLGLEKDKEVSFVKLAKYHRTLESDDEENGDRIAIIYAEGDIVSGKGQEGEVGSDKFAKALKEARLNKDVKAVVLRVNSPGGSALASDVIWREALLLKREKPLIVSMGDVAASGGYYISCIADTIVAMPNTITGSIGVFGMFPNAEKMFDKLGMHTEYVKTADFSDFGRIDRALNTQEIAVLTGVIENIYADFVNRVAEGRKLTYDQVDSIAQGRVWTGTMAKGIGLIDVYGGLNQAIAIAASKANLSTYRLKSYPESKNPFEEFFVSFGGMSFKQQILKEELGVQYKVYQQLKRLENLSGIQAIMPFTIGLN